MIYDTNDTTEAEWLDSQGQDLAEMRYWIGIGRYTQQKESLREARSRCLDRLTANINRAKAVKVGEMVSCPNCDTKTVKTTYHKTFCSNAKTHGTKNCKDQFHNRINALKELLKT